MTDEELIKGCKERQFAAQETLYKRFAPAMMGVCLRYAKDDEQAQDFLQDGFIKVFENIDTYKATGTLKGWIKTIMINTALEYIRKNKSAKLQVPLDETQHFNIPSQSETSSRLATGELLAAIRSLPEGYRTIFNLYAIEGYTHAEIAAQLVISEGTSKSQYARARQQLIKILEKQNIPV